jgi:predicted nucleic acid-binding protein
VSVFIDTSALLALLDADDPAHERARNAWNQLADEEASLVSTNYVVVETVSVAQHRLGMDAVRALVDDILPVIEVRIVDAIAHNAAVAALLAANRRQLSLVDCVSFEVMRQGELQRALAFDKHFKERGFTLRS